MDTRGMSEPGHVIKVDFQKLPPEELYKNLMEAKALLRLTIEVLDKRIYSIDNNINIQVEEFKQRIQNFLNK